MRSVAALLAVGLVAACAAADREPTVREGAGPAPPSSVGSPVPTSPLPTQEGGSQPALPDASLLDGTTVAAPPADASTSLDAPAVPLDAPAAIPVDASPPTAAFSCGSEVCRVDQLCVASKCTFPCSGVAVPGAYATLQAAIDGLAAAGQDATICLAEQSYTETVVQVRDPGAHGKRLTIVGPSAAHTTITSQILWQGGWSALSFRGVRTTSALLAGFAGQPGTIALVGARLEGTTGVEATGGEGTAEISLDGCDIATGVGWGVKALSRAGQSLSVSITNSYAHGCRVAAGADTTGTGAVDLRFVGNTVVGCDGGVVVGKAAVGSGLGSSAGGVTLRVANNAFTGAVAALSIDGTVAAVTQATNAFWANTSNTYGSATLAPSDLAADCLLEGSGVPTLKAASPCRQKATAALATSVDYYGAVRSSPSDLGAVEGP